MPIESSLTLVRGWALSSLLFPLKVFKRFYTAIDGAMAFLLRLGGRRLPICDLISFEPLRSKRGPKRLCDFGRQLPARQLVSIFGVRKPKKIVAGGFWNFRTFRRWSFWGIRHAANLSHTRSVVDNHEIKPLLTRGLPTWIKS